MLSKIIITPALSYGCLLYTSSVDIAEEFAHEKLSPVLAMYKAKTFDEALDKAAQLVADGGYGHKMCIRDRSCSVRLQ